MTTPGSFETIREQTEGLPNDDFILKVLPKTPRIRPMKPPRYDIPLLILPPSVAYLDSRSSKHVLDLLERGGKSMTAARAV